MFDEVAAKGLNVRGYYDDKYWGKENDSQGCTFVYQSEGELRAKARVEAAEKKVHQMSEVLNHWHALLRQKFPDEDWQVSTY